MIGIGQYFVSHASLRAVLESVQEISVGDTLPHVGYSAPSQELLQMSLLKSELVLLQNLEEVVVTNETETVGIAGLQAGLEGLEALSQTVLQPRLHLHRPMPVLLVFLHRRLLLFLRFDRLGPGPLLLLLAGLLAQSSGWYSLC